MFVLFHSREGTAWGSPWYSTWDEQVVSYHHCVCVWNNYDCGPNREKAVYLVMSSSPVPLSLKMASISWWHFSWCWGWVARLYRVQAIPMCVCVCVCVRMWTQVDLTIGSCVMAFKHERVHFCSYFKISQSNIVFILSIGIHLCTGNNQGYGRELTLASSKMSRKSRYFRFAAWTTPWPTPCFVRQHHQHHTRAFRLLPQHLSL